MRIPRVEKALADCEAVRSSARPSGPDVQDLLARSLLVLVYAEFERVIRGQLLERCAGIPDASVSKFVENCISSVFRSLGISALSGLLGRFDEESRKHFQSRVDQDTTNRYDSLIRNRNAVAHAEGPAPTLDEVRDYYLHAHVVLDHFREALFREPGAGEGRANGIA